MRALVHRECHAKWSAAGCHHGQMPVGGFRWHLGVLPRVLAPSSGLPTTDDLIQTHVEWRRRLWHGHGIDWHATAWHSWLFPAGFPLLEWPTSSPAYRCATTVHVVGTSRGRPWSPLQGGLLALFFFVFATVFPCVSGNTYMFIFLIKM